MTLDELANDPGLLILVIAITLVVLLLVDELSRRFWRWWRR